jgi:hypothetical protein
MAQLHKFFCHTGRLEDEPDGIGIGLALGARDLDKAGGVSGKGEGAQEIPLAAQGRVALIDGHGGGAGGMLDVVGDGGGALGMVGPPGVDEVGTGDRELRGPAEGGSGCLDGDLRD